MRPVPTASLGIVLGLILLGSCSEPPPATRVLLVGIDGASLRVMEPMLAAGRLPSLARIAEQGAWGELRSDFPLQSPRIWTSIATGKKPERHRILHFTVPTAEGGKRLVASHDRVGHALWNILSDRARKVAVVNWWVTYPAEPVQGVMVSDHFLPGVVAGRERFFHASSEETGPVVHPASWRPRVAAAVAGRQRTADAPDPFVDLDLPDWVRQDRLAEWYRDDASVGAIALEIEAELQPDLMMVLFKGVDAASHVLFAMLERPELEPAQPAGSEAERAAGAEALTRFYEQSDRSIGALLERYGPRDLVLVVSDHGFETRHRYTELTGQHKGPLARHGILFARGRGIEPGARVADVSIYDVTPTILAWLGLPVADDMDGEPAAFLPQAARPAPDPPGLASYDAATIVRSRVESAETEARILEQLEALGYFEAESGDERGSGAQLESGAQGGSGARAERDAATAP